MSQQYPQSASTEGLRDRSLLGRVEDHASNNFPALLSHTVEDENDDDDLHTDLEQLSLRKDEPVLRGAPRIMGWTTTWQMVALTICLAGLQFTWTVELAYGTPYLLSLGLSKSFMSLVWIAGPLSGLVMQPIVGALSDKCTSTWGRRRPFIVGGSAVVVFVFIIIGWTRDIAAMLTGYEAGEVFARVAIWIAVFSIYILDFAINTVQAAIRALIVDSLPPSQQEDGTAWAGRMVGIGSVVGYFMGYIDLVAMLGFMGNTQLKILCIIASLILLACDGITCYTVTERVLVHDGRHGTSKKSRDSPFKTLSIIFSHIWHLPLPIRRLCNIQFFAWIGWFPFLFYSTTWVAEIATRTSLTASVDATTDVVGQVTRAGSYAFLIHSLISLTASFLLPLIIAPSDSSATPTPGPRVITLFDHKLHIPSFILPGLTLPRAWAASHLLFCIAMLGTALVSTTGAASVVIGFCGVSWSITMWAPFSLLGEFIARSEVANPEVPRGLGIHAQGQVSRVSLAAGTQGTGHDGGMYTLVETVVDEEYEMAGGTGVRVVEGGGVEVLGNGNGNGSGVVHHHHRDVLDDEDEHRHMIAKDPLSKHDDDHTGSPATSAGILLGIHNMYIVLPQFLVTFLSSILFRVLEPDTASAPASEEMGEVAAGADTIGVVLRFGGVMAGVAAVLAWSLSRQV